MPQRHALLSPLPHPRERGREGGREGREGGRGGREGGREGERERGSEGGREGGRGEGGREGGRKGRIRERKEVKTNFKFDLSGECVAMVDGGLPILPIPTVQFHTATAQVEHLQSIPFINSIIQFHTANTQQC